MIISERRATSDSKKYSQLVNEMRQRLEKALEDTIEQEITFFNISREQFEDLAETSLSEEARLLLQTLTSPEMYPGTD